MEAVLAAALTPGVETVHTRGGRRAVRGAYDAVRGSDDDGTGRRLPVRRYRLAGPRRIRRTRAPPPVRDVPGRDLRSLPRVPTGRRARLHRGGRRVPRSPAPRLRARAPTPHTAPGMGGSLRWPLGHMVAGRCRAASGFGPRPRLRNDPRREHGGAGDGDAALPGGSPPVPWTGGSHDPVPAPRPCRGSVLAQDMSAADLTARSSVGGGGGPPAQPSARVPGLAGAGEAEQGSSGDRSPPGHVDCLADRRTVGIQPGAGGQHDLPRSVWGSGA